ncbi:MAG: carboxypeptidase-like regulatory domain-containing protein [Candidatus Bathyarchaeia archaeon]
MMKRAKLYKTSPLIVILWIASMLLIPLAMNTLNANAQDELQVTVSVTSDGEYTTITGVVTDSNHDPVEGARVSIQVNDPSGKTIHMELTYSDENGEYSDKFRMPENVNGECTIYVTASKPGYGVGGNTSSFTAVPEFSEMLLALAAPLVFMLKTLKKRQ